MESEDAVCSPGGCTTRLCPEPDVLLSNSIIILLSVHGLSTCSVLFRFCNYSF